MLCTGNVTCICEQIHFYDAQLHIRNVFMLDERQTNHLHRTALCHVSFPSLQNVAWAFHVLYILIADFSELFNRNQNQLCHVVI